MFKKEKTFDDIMEVFTKTAKDLGDLITSKNEDINKSQDIIDEHVYKINSHNLVISKAQTALHKISDILGK